MKTPLFYDILLNVTLPVLAGFFIYVLHGTLNLPPFLRNYLPDGLWAYAFLSAILIIWQRELNPTWIIACIGVSICFEVLQYFQHIAGTGDILDILAYGFFFYICIKTNHYFKTCFQPERTK